MKFKPGHDDQDLCERLVSEDGKIEMGVYTVAFGYRVRAGYVGSFVYFLDYCCGNSQEAVETIYSLVKHILEQRESDDSPFMGFPKQDRKPFPLDIVNYVELLKIGEGFQKVKLRPIHEIREYQLSQLF